MTAAINPAGPWQPLHRVLEGTGWDDPCPLWDDDGQGYLAGTSFRDSYKTHLWKLTPGGRDLVQESDRIIHRSKRSEANKLYKFDGLYYHLFSEVHAEGRVVMMERSKHIFGPYTEIRQLNYADRPAMEPNQGGLVQTESGAWYWFTHHGTGDWEGRCASLVQAKWIDGWPIIGEPDEKSIGHFVWSGKTPVGGAQIPALQTSDEFGEARLSPQWEWNHQPRAEKWSLTERPGWLRLPGFRPLQPGDLRKAGNTLTQRSFRTTGNEVVVKFDLRGMADGSEPACATSPKTTPLLASSRAGRFERSSTNIAARSHPDLR